jgi:hypothetical protein
VTSFNSFGSPRALLKSPGFFVVASAAVALGIGASTAVFTVVRAVLLRPLPVYQADRLATVNSVSVPNFLDWREQSRAFEGMPAYTSAGVNLIGTEPATPPRRPLFVSVPRCRAQMLAPPEILDPAMRALQQQHLPELKAAALDITSHQYPYKFYLSRRLDLTELQELFDGKTLDGWIQIENSATSLSGSGITDSAAFLRKLTTGPDAVSVFLRSRLQDSVRTDLAAFVKDLNQVISGPSIYDKARFSSIAIRPETEQLLKQNPGGQQLARLNKLLLEDAYPAELAKSSLTGWVVKDGAMASIGAGRGVIYTAKDYSRFRLMFTMRHVSGSPDHQACILIFCTRPQPGEKPLDALGGIQFQVPNGGHWDYRPGMNSNGGQEFTSVTKTRFDAHTWSRVEILADAAKGTARMAVSQSPGSKAVEVLDFKDAATGKVGPIAWQMHNAGLFDEYKDVTIELDPKDDDLITVK